MFLEVETDGSSACTLPRLDHSKRLMTARLNRLLKNSRNAKFVSGHGFSRADKPFIFYFGEADFSPTSVYLEFAGSL